MKDKQLEELLNLNGDIVENKTGERYLINSTNLDFDKVIGEMTVNLIKASDIPTNENGIPILSKLNELKQYEYTLFELQKDFKIIGPLINKKQ